jgi:hypothetical protein
VRFPAEPKKVLTDPGALVEFELKEKTIISHNVAMCVFLPDVAAVQ